MLLQLNDVDNLADDVTADDCDEHPAATVSVSSVKTKKKRRKKTKDKSASDANAVVLCSLLYRIYAHGVSLVLI